MTIRTLALSVLLALCGALRADEVRLQDGRVLYGTVKTTGDHVRVSTRDGVVDVDSREVVRVRSAEELRAELRDLAERAGHGPHGAIEIARLARDRGLADEMWQWLDRALEAQPSPALQARLQELLATLGPELLGELKPANAKGQARFALLAARENSRPSRRAAAARILAGIQDDDAWAVVQLAARNSSVESDRCIALRALALRGTPSDQRTVWRATVVDPSASVRETAVAIARDTATTAQVIGFLAPALVHDSIDVRVRAAEALAGLGDRAAIAPLAAAGPTAAVAATSSPGSTRSYIAFLEQRAYVRDFDPEVAQSAFIADPKIDVLQSGSVLDVTVNAVISERVVTTFRRAIGKLAGADPGGDPASWSRWAAAREKSVIAPHADR